MYSNFFAKAAVAFFLGSAALLSAQDRPSEYTPLRPPGALSPPPPGKLVLPNHPAEPVSSLYQLVTMSAIIIDGTVVNSLPPISPNPDSPDGAQTAAVISVNRTVFGKAPASGQILLVETGGQIGKWQVSVEGDSLVRAGERYIFFLTPAGPNQIFAANEMLPDPTKVPRYSPIGYANGKALVSTTGGAQFAPGAISKLHSFDSSESGVFLEKITACINEVYPPVQPYPV